MRRFLFGVVIASVTAAMPAWAFGGDREIAKTVMSQLQQHKDAGDLRGFDIDLKVENGIVYLTGEVSSNAQRALVTSAAINAVGSENLVDEIKVRGAKPVESTVRQVAKATPVPMPVQQPAPMIRQASTVQASPSPARNDVAITDVVIGQLQQSKAAGLLRGFELDVSTVNGDVWLRGKVSNQAQKSHVLDIARRVQGVARVVDDITVTDADPIQQASTESYAMEPTAPAPIPRAVPQAVPGSSMPIVGADVGPQPFAPSSVVSMNMGGYSGAPVPMQGAGGEYGIGAPRYDQPSMPSYAWPSYAAHPNYAAVTYPKQYSPSAWPYIGPFYPYPQVPLGWRKVALEWDDGLWYLDFTSK